MTRRGLRFVLAVSLLVASQSRAWAQALELDSATVADLNAAFDKGTLTSERLVQLSLARIDAYDRKGPGLRAVITLNPKALETARALDAERKAKGKRSPLHGIPIVLKDNYDTFDLPTTGGSILLEGSIPPDDAFVVKKLREAGAIIVAKVNMSEFASGGARSSIIGQSRNPHALDRTPSGSSGGTGVAIAAGYATIGLGTDTGGSIRGPVSSNGIVGLKPTLGLLSRDGIIPLALSFDTGGPMARSVYDVAVALGIMTGVDAADAATRASDGKAMTDYTKFLNAGALKGARIGIARDFMGADGEVDWLTESAIATMKKAGATVRDHGLPLIRQITEGVFASQTLDAVIYPTSPKRPDLIAAPPETPGGASTSGTNIANLTGFPDLIVPAGFTADGLPVGLSFLGPAFSEGKLLGLGYSFEQLTHARRRPVHTPALPGETVPR